MNSSNHNHTRGYALAAGAAVLWGTSSVTAKYLFNSRIDPFDLLTLRTMIAALLHLAWLGLALPHLLRVDWRAALAFAPLGLIGLAFNQGLYYRALTLTSVSYALLLQYLAPLLLLAYGIASKTERMTAGKVVAVAATVGGAAVMVLGRHGTERVSLWGTVCAGGSACAFAFYSGYGKHLLRRHDSRTVMGYTLAWAGLWWLLVRPPWTIPWGDYSRAEWGFILYLAAAATVGSFGLYLASLRHLEPSRANLTTTLEPVVATTLAWFWLGERMTGRQWLGGAAVIGGVVLLQLEGWLRARD